VIERVVAGSDDRVKRISGVVPFIDFLARDGEHFGRDDANARLTAGDARQRDANGALLEQVAYFHFRRHRIRRKDQDGFSNPSSEYQHDFLLNRSRDETISTSRDYRFEA